MLTVSYLSYAIPVVTRFVADFLGFGEDIKTEEHLDRKYDENQIYKHFTNCQDFLTFNADETTAWKRRVDFTKSMQFLKDTTERCVDAAQPGIFGSIFGGPSYGSAKDGETVKSLRKFGAEIAKVLVKEKRKTKEEAAAIMLYTAIDATYKCILVVSYGRNTISNNTKLTFAVCQRSLLLPRPDQRRALESNSESCKSDC